MVGFPYICYARSLQSYKIQYTCSPGRVFPSSILKGDDQK